MKITRAVLLGALLWVLVFFEVSILMFGFGLTSGTISYFLIHYVFLGIFSIIVGLIYFRKAKSGALEGLKAWAVMLVTGIILDAAITVPLFVKTYSFFINPSMLGGYLETAILIVLVGILKNKKN
jgi:hypothetical protein